MSHKTSLFAAFLLGACASATTDMLAEEPAPPKASATVADGAAAGVTRVAPNGTAKVTVLAQGNNAFVARLEMDGHAEVPQHRDSTEEYIVVLEGGGTLLMDGKPHQLQKGSAVFMPANAEVSFANGPETMVAIQVFAGPEPAAKYDAWKKPTD